MGLSHWAGAGCTAVNNTGMVLALKCPWSSEGDSEWPGITVHCENARVRKDGCCGNPEEGHRTPQMKGEASAKLSWKQTTKTGA